MSKPRRPRHRYKESSGFVTSSWSRLQALSKISRGFKSKSSKMWPKLNSSSRSLSSELLNKWPKIRLPSTSSTKKQYPALSFRRKYQSRSRTINRLTTDHTPFSYYLSQHSYPKSKLRSSSFLKYNYIAIEYEFGWELQPYHPHGPVSGEEKRSGGKLKKPQCPQKRSQKPAAIRVVQIIKAFF